MNIIPPIETLHGPEAIAMLKRLGPVSPKACHVILAPQAQPLVILFCPRTNTPATISRWKFDDMETALAHRDELRSFYKEGENHHG